MLASDGYWIDTNYINFLKISLSNVAFQALRLVQKHRYPKENILLCTVEILHEISHLRWAPTWRTLNLHKCVTSAANREFNRTYIQQVQEIDTNLSHEMNELAPRALWLQTQGSRITGNSFIVYDRTLLGNSYYALSIMDNMKCSLANRITAFMTETL